MTTQIILTPSGKLQVEADDASLKAAFNTGSGSGLLYLDCANDNFTESPEFAYWKDFCRLYLTSFTATPELEKCDLSKSAINIPFPKEDLYRLLLTIPPMKGAEYVNEV
jgi:hypothetical protein